MPLNKKFGGVGLLLLQLELSTVLLSFLAFYAVALLCTRVVYHYEAYLREGRVRGRISKASKLGPLVLEAPMLQKPSITHNF